MGYSYNYSVSGAEDEVIMAVLGVYAVFVGVAALFGIAMYVIRSLSVYTVAKRRGLENPWLSWLPVGHEWILGCLSDQYKYIVQKKRQNRRKVLLGLGIGTLVTGLLAVGLLISGLVVGSMNGDAAPAAGLVLLGVLMYLAMAVTAVVSMVFCYICKYDIYKSCDPKNAVAYLVISIFINVTEPFFLLCCRNKDLGMDPNNQPVPEAPVTTSGDEAPKTAPAAEETAAEEPTPAQTAALPVGSYGLPAGEEAAEAAPTEPEEEVPADEPIILSAPAQDAAPEETPAAEEAPAEE